VATTSRGSSRGWTALLLVVLVILAPTVLAEPLLPRPLREKPAHSELWPGLRPDLLVVKFVDAAAVRLRDGRLRSTVGVSTRTANALTVDAPDVTVSRLFTRSEDELARDRAEAEARSGRAMADLDGYYALHLPGGDPARAEALLDALNALDVVEIAYAEPVPENAVLDDPGPRPRRGRAATTPSAPATPPGRPAAGRLGTPDFTDLQDYHDPAPLGIDVAAAWAQPGGRGAGIRIVDVETGSNFGHEDMPPPFYVGGVTSITDHGVAVMGEIAAPDNGYGVVGIVPDATVGAHSVLEVPAPVVFDEAGAQLGVGDILVIELQAPGPAPGGSITNVPMEYFQANFDVFRMLSARGVIVCAAAGNGSADLDDPVYEGLFDRDVRDSGAIMVGATDGGSLDPAGFSNHGSRVDLSGWGFDVVTCGYGDLHGTTPDDEYTAGFSGTSSATPIVVGAVAALQGIHLAAGGDPLPGRTLADLLIATGTATGGPELIGPRPDLAQAVPALMAPMVEVSGTVHDLDAAPIGDADVRVLENGARTRTAPDGSFALVLVPGNWTVRITAFGYTTAEYEVTLGPGGTDDRATELAPLPVVTVSGTVVDQGGAPVEGAEVRIANAPFPAATTDASGAYAIEGVPVPFEGVATATRADLAPDARVVATGIGPVPVDFRLVSPDLTFEDDDGGFSRTGEWEWGIPAFPDGPAAHGGLRCWGTDLDGTYSPSFDHRLTFDVTVPGTNPRLAFWHWYDVWGPYDGIQVQVSDGGPYEPLPPVGGYPEACIWNLGGDPCGPGWSYRSEGWRPAVHDLSSFAGQTISVRLLLVTSTFSQGPGWYVDDLAVFADDDVIGVGDAGARPVTRLAPVTPSPTRGAARISFELAEGGPVALRVFDVAGRRVADLFQGTLETGPHQLVWDGRADGADRVGAGVYFVELVSGGTATSRAVHRSKVVIAR